MVMEPSPVLNQMNASATGPTGAQPLNSQNKPDTVKPNVASIGREFVRQYYTMLHEDPLHLHRFYGSDSSYIHGGINKQGSVTNAVIGQMAINEKIISLNFKNCHAKIEQIDSLETIGDSVVIQVVGEFSSNGQPMRRFSQTFVLVLQKPNSYYIRNDILRYQDEVFNEDEDECNETDKLESDGEGVELQQLTKVSDEEKETNEEGFINGSVHNDVGGDHTAQQEIAEQKVVSGEEDDWNNSGAEIEREDEPGADPINIGKQGQQDVEPSQQTFANVVSKNATTHYTPPFSTSATSFVPKTDGIGVQAVPFQKLTDSSPNPVSLVSVVPPGPTTTPPQFVPGGKPPIINNMRDQRMPRPSRNMNVRRNDARELTPSRSESESVSFGTENAEPFVQRKQYTDEQQVFVGNLPQNIEEEQLRAFFSKYGKILDVRINRQNQKSGMSRTPNYGFVTFDEPAIVKEILSQKPIYFNDHRFNVEEKRSQSSRNQGPGGSGSGGGIGDRGSLSRSGSGGGGQNSGVRMNHSMNNMSGGRDGRFPPGPGGGPRDYRPRGVNYNRDGGGGQGRQQGGQGGGTRHTYNNSRR